MYFVPKKIGWRWEEKRKENEKKRREEKSRGRKQRKDMRRPLLQILLFVHTLGHYETKRNAFYKPHITHEEVKIGCTTTNHYETRCLSNTPCNNDELGRAAPLYWRQRIEAFTRRTTIVTKMWEYKYICFQLSF